MFVTKFDPNLFDGIFYFCFDNFETSVLMFFIAWVAHQFHNYNLKNKR